ncbi:MAG: SEC-C domain-containing protein [Lachnospiraceae bacterium]|nr:SEC-C domain-containing protein [Lachnospiraceae bacterium]
MIFISYQPLTKREGEDLNNENVNTGEERFEPILERDKKYIDYFGYNPYWACGGNNHKDIILQSIFSSPNNPFMLHIFETDDYTRINKIKREQCIIQGQGDNFLSQIDENCDDIMSEFLVKSLLSDACVKVSLVWSDSYPDIRKIILPSPTWLPDFFIEQWNEVIYKLCRNVPHYDVIDKSEFIKRGKFTELGYEAHMMVRRNKFICEMAILPVLLQIILSKNERNNGTISLNTCYIYENVYTWRELMKLGQRYSYLNLNHEINEDNYKELVNRGRRLIIDDFNVLTPLMDGMQIYPNDTCPCGSGKKYKKCHGNIISSI